MKINLLITGFLLLNLLASAQRKSSILIYSENSEYLVPYMEQTIENLSDTSGNLLFKEVKSLNRLFANMNYELYLRDVMKFYSSNNFSLSNEAKLAQEDVSITLSSYDFLLKIKTFTFGEFVEYQIDLFQSILSKENQPGGKDYFPSLKVDDPINTINFLIDLKDNDYKEIIYNNLKKLFPETNYPPVAIISHNMKEQFGKVFVGLGDTLKLEASNSFDVDSQISELSYEWAQLGIDGNFNISAEERLRILKNEDNQALTFSKTGGYVISLQLFDGIEYSIVDTISIEVIKKPIILLHNKELTYNWATSIAEQSNFLRKAIISEQLSIGLLFEKESLDSNNLKIEGVTPSIDSLNLITLYLSYKDCGCSYEELLKDFSKTPYSITRKQVDDLGFIVDFSTDVGLAEGKKEFQIYYEHNGVKSNVESLILKINRHSPFRYKLNYFFGAFPYKYLDLQKDTSMVSGYQGINLGVSGLLYNELGFNADINLPLERDRLELIPVRLKWFSEISLGYTFWGNRYDSSIAEANISWVLSSFNNALASSWGISVSGRRPIFLKNLFVGIGLQFVAQRFKELDQVALLGGGRFNLKLGISYRPRLNNLKKRLMRRRLFPDLY